MNGIGALRTGILGNLLVIGTLASTASGQEAVARTESRAASLEDVRHIYVPADTPETWPPGDWLPMATADVQAFADSQNDPSLSAPRAFLERMVYRARFSGQALQGGTLEGTVRLRSEHPQFLTLGSPSLFLNKLSWPDRDAFWGSTSKGQALLRVEDDLQTLSGRWSLTGQRVMDNVEFDVSVPPSVVSQFEIEIPESARLLLEGGLVSQVFASERAGWKVWTIDLGHRTSCRMIVVPIDGPSASPAKGVQASQAIQHSLRLDGLHLQVDVTVERAPPVVAALEFLVPGEMQFSPVTVGNEQIVPVERRKAGTSDLLRVETGGLTLAPGTTIRLRGKLPFPVGQIRELPRIQLQSGQLLRTRQSVMVVRPLELSDIRATGCQLLESSLGSGGEDSLEYEDYAPESRIAVRVDRPEPNFSATVVSHVQWRDDDPLMRSSILLKALSGSTFSVECRVPGHWEVTKLESNAATPVSQWKYSPGTADPDGHDGVLFIEFRKPLSPQVSAELVIWCRQHGSLPGPVMAEFVGVPAVVPDVSGDCEVWLVVEPLEGVRFDIEDNSAFQRVSVNSVRDEWGALLPEDLSQDNDDQLLVLRADDLPDEGRPIVVSRADANVKVQQQSPGGVSVPPEPTSPDPESEPPLSNGRPFVDGSLPLSAPLSVETVVAIEGGQVCRNRAVFELPSTSVVRELAFHLPQSTTLITAKLIDALEGQVEGNILISRQSIRLKLEPSLDRCQLELLYDSPLTQSMISGSAQIPLPQWNGNSRTIAWDVLLPIECRLTAPTDGVSAQRPAGVSWSQRLFGPLGRFSNDRFLSLFWPNSRHSALTSEISGNSAVALTAGRPPRIRIHRSVPGGNASLRLTFWSARQARRAGWVTLAIGLFLSTWPHRRQRLIKFGGFLPIILSGVVVAFFAPDFLAIPCGGFVMGTILGLLIPDDWRVCTSGRPRGHHARGPQTPRVASQLSASGLCLLLCLGVWSPALPAWQARESADRDDSGTRLPERSPADRLDVLIPIDSADGPPDRLPPVVYLRRDQIQDWSRHHAETNPAVLIRSAEYEVRGFESSDPRVSARFDVVLFQPEHVRHVAIPITGAFFPDARSCRVDGIPSTISPSRQSQGVVVDLSPALEETPVESQGQDSESERNDELQPSPRPRSVRVDLECRPRPSEATAGPRLQLGIPTVLDSQAVFRVGHPESPKIDLAHRGAAQSPRADGLWRVALGGLAQLVANPEDPRLSGRWLEPDSAVSMVETHPLIHHVSSRLVFDIHHEALALSARTLVLELPSESVIHDVRAPGLNRMRTEMNEELVRLYLIFQDLPTSKLAVELEFDLRIPPADNEGGVILPALPFLEDPSVIFPVQYVGVSAAPGFEITRTRLSDSDAESHELLSGRLTDWLGARRIRNPDVTHVLESARPIAIPLGLITPAVDVSASQILTVRESRIDWTGRLDVTVRDAPVLAHRIEIDPRLQIEHISVRQEGVERIANWSRASPQKLTVFLAEEFTGSHTLHLEGAFSTRDGELFAVPTIGLADARLLDLPTLLIRHTEEQLVEVHRGTQSIPQPDARSPSAAIGALHDLGPFRVDKDSEPLFVRIEGQGSAGNLVQVTTLRPTSDALIEQVCTLRADGVDNRRPVLNVMVAGLSHEFEVQSSLVVREQVRMPDGKVTFQLALPESPLSTWNLKIVSRKKLAGRTSWPLPTWTASGARVDRQFVVFPNDMALDHSGTEFGHAAVAELPRWYREQTSITAENWNVWQVEPQERPIELFYQGDQAASIQMLDSAIWQPPDGLWRGVTVADIVAHRDTSTSFVIPHGMTVDAVTLDGADDIEQTEQEVRLALKKRSSPHRCIIWWTLSDQRHAGLDVPLPRPAQIEGSHANVAVLGHSDRYYLIRGQNDRKHTVAMLSALSSADSRVGAVSPITRAMESAGVGPFFETSVTDVPDSPGVMSVRLPATETTLRVHSVDRQIVHLSLLLVVAFVLVMIWLILGQWIDVPQLSNGAVSLSSFGMLAMGLVLWYWGSGLCAVLLILIGAWRSVVDLRKSRNRAAVNPAAGQALSAGPQ